MTDRISNIKLGELLGLSHASVSRYRSGDRLPSSETMAEISRLTGWTMDEQYKARTAGTYAEKFEQVFSGVDYNRLLTAVPAQRSE